MEEEVAALVCKFSYLDMLGLNSLDRLGYW